MHLCTIQVTILVYEGVLRRSKNDAHQIRFVGPLHSASVPAQHQAACNIAPLLNTDKNSLCQNRIFPPFHSSPFITTLISRFTSFFPEAVVF